jgi:hypothetical protein
MSKTRNTVRQVARKKTLLHKKQVGLAPSHEDDRNAPVATPPPSKSRPATVVFVSRPVNKSRTWRRMCQRDRVKSHTFPVITVY